MTARLTETPEFLQSLSLSNQAGDLFRRAYSSRNDFWSKILRRDYTKTAEWKAAQELLKQAYQQSFPLMAQELRSPDLKSEMPLNDCRSEQARNSVVHSVVERRAAMLGLGAQRMHPEPCLDLEGGRLLICVPEETLSDGAAAVESNWFFDDDNVPPWDTWVAYSARTLLSWVPPQLVSLVQKGIEVNIEGCIRWMED